MFKSHPRDVFFFFAWRALSNVITQREDSEGNWRKKHKTVCKQPVSWSAATTVWQTTEVVTGHVDSELLRQ